MRLFLLVVFCALGPAFSQRVVCYWNGRSILRQNAGKVSPRNIRSALPYCTHLLFGFAVLDDQYDLISPVHINGVSPWKSAAALRNTGVSVLLSIGGNEVKDNEEKYLNVLENEERRTQFIDKIINVLNKHNFDGIDLAWQFPVHLENYEKRYSDMTWHKKDKSQNINEEEIQEIKGNFLSLVNDLASQLRKKKKILSIGVLPQIDSKKYFYMNYLMPHVNFVNLWAADFYTPDDSPLQADFAHPLHSYKDRPSNKNAEAVVREWLDNGSIAKKLNLGIATWGRTWELQKGVAHDSVTAPAEAVGPGHGGPYTHTKGLLSYNEICNDVFCYRDTQPSPEMELKLGFYGFWIPDENKEDRIWVGYEDPLSATRKTQWAKDMGLGGVSILDLGLDDAQGLCDGNKFPITQATSKIIL